MNRPLIAFLALAALGVAAAFETRLSIFTFLLLIIGFAALTRFEHPKKKLVAIALSLGMLGTSVGLFRFILQEALPGIIEARGRASSSKAVSLLREVLFAQDAARRYAMIDPDGDGVGSAGLLGELTAAAGVRGTQKLLSTPPLASRYRPTTPTRSGPAMEADGYLFLICLPKATNAVADHTAMPANAFTAEPTAPIDDELAEKNWHAYAWPVSPTGPHQDAFFINAAEAIKTHPNKRPDGALVFAGPSNAPSCDSAQNDKSWSPWRGKLPRKELPGAKP